MPKLQVDTLDNRDRSFDHGPAPTNRKQRSHSPTILIPTGIVLRGGLPTPPPFVGHLYQDDQHSNVDTDGGRNHDSAFPDSSQQGPGINGPQHAARAGKPQGPELTMGHSPTSTTATTPKSKARASHVDTLVEEVQEAESLGSDMNPRRREEVITLMPQHSRRKSRSPRRRRSRNRTLSPNLARGRTDTRRVASPERNLRAVSQEEYRKHAGQPKHVKDSGRRHGEPRSQPKHADNLLKTAVVGGLRDAGNSTIIALGKELSEEAARRFPTAPAVHQRHDARRDKVKCVAVFRERSGVPC